MLQLVKHSDDVWKFCESMLEVKGIPAPWKDRWTLPGATLKRRGSALLGELSLRDLEDLLGVSYGTCHNQVKLLRLFWLRACRR